MLITSGPVNKCVKMFGCGHVEAFELRLNHYQYPCVYIVYSIEVLVCVLR